MWTTNRIQAREDFACGGRNTVDLLHHVVGAAKISFHAGTVVTRDVDDHGVVELARLTKRIDHSSDLVIGLGHKTCENFHEPCSDFLLIVVQGFPRRQFCWPRSKYCIGWNHTKLLLSFKD